MNKFKKKILVILFLVIGLSETFFELFYTKYTNPISAFSPLPLLFSYGRGGRPKQTQAKIFVYTKYNKYAFITDKKFYNSLSGPHHYRHIFVLKLDRAKYLLHPDRIESFLDKIICKEEIKIQQFKGEKVKSIVIAFANGQEILNYRCQ